MKTPTRPSPCRMTLTALLACILAGVASAAGTAAPALDPLDPLLRPAAAARQAAASVLIAVTRAGDRLVAAGESGIVLTSDDDGEQWHQAQVPVSVTLTSVHFPTAAQGWAVGHSGVILATTDGGLTWVRQLDGRQVAALPVEPVQEPPSDAPDADPSPAPQAGDPLLDVLFLDAREGFAVGAFGLFLHTVDGGAHWTRAPGRLSNPDGNHLYAIRLIGDRLYVAGERGAVFVSQDRGARFEAVKTPYEGSFFGITGRAGGEVVVYGLQGRVFASSDHGASWRDLGGEGRGAWTAAAAWDDGRIVLVGQAGDVGVVAAGAGLSKLSAASPPLSAVAVAANGGLVTVGPRGIHRIARAAVADGSAVP